MSTAREILTMLRARTAQRNSIGAWACIPLIEGDDLLYKLALAWPKVRPAEYPKEVLALECPPATPADKQVRWLWALIPDPMPRWIEIAGLPRAPHVIRACYQLVDHEAVLPDGTLAVAVESYLQRKVGAFVTSLMPRRARPVPAQPEPQPAPATEGSDAVPASTGG